MADGAARTFSPRFRASPDLRHADRELSGGSRSVRRRRGLRPVGQAHRGRELARQRSVLPGAALPLPPGGTLFLGRSQPRRGPSRPSCARERSGRSRAAVRGHRRVRGGAETRPVVRRSARQPRVDLSAPRRRAGGRLEAPAEARTGRENPRHLPRNTVSGVLFRRVDRRERRQVAATA